MFSGSDLATQFRRKGWSSKPKMMEKSKQSAMKPKAPVDLSEKDKRQAA